MQDGGCRPGYNKRGLTRKGGSLSLKDCAHSQCFGVPHNLKGCHSRIDMRFKLDFRRPACGMDKHTSAVCFEPQSRERSEPHATPGRRSPPKRQNTNPFAGGCPSVIQRTADVPSQGTRERQQQDTGAFAELCFAASALKHFIPRGGKGLSSHRDGSDHQKGDLAFFNAGESDRRPKTRVGQILELDQTSTLMTANDRADGHTWTGSRG